MAAGYGARPTRSNRRSPLAIGQGRSAIVIWDEAEGVRTVIIGVNRRIDELNRVAEELK